MTWVAVYGPADSTAPGDLVLEVGDTAWYGYGGVVSVEAEAGLEVRLVERGTCRIYARLMAPAGTMWVIRFGADGSVTTKAVDDMDAGPALAARPPSGCP